MRALVLWVALIAAGCDGCEPEPRTTIPSVTAPRVEDPPTLDGRLEEAAWRHAPSTERFVRTMDGRRGEPESIARFLWDDTHLYIAFVVADPFLKSTLEGHDAHLWEQDVVEVMIDPDGDGRDYVELQVAPTGTVFDTRFDTRRRPAPFGHLGWQSELEAGVHTEGEVNDDAKDDGWAAELAIPFASLPGDAPAAGDDWRVALYVLDALPEGQRGVGWSPPLVRDFHVPERFGRLRFGE